MNRQQALAVLRRQHIMTTADLDAYRVAHATDQVIDSRYGTLARLIGADHAMNIIEALAAQQCI